MQEAEIIKSCTNTKTGISYWYCIADDGHIANKYLLSKNVYKEDGVNIMWSVNGKEWKDSVDIPLLEKLVNEGGWF